LTGGDAVKRRAGKSAVLLALTMVFLFGTGALASSDSAITVKIGGESAAVSLLEGSAWLKKQGKEPEQPLKSGSRVFAGDVVRTGGGSRLELALPEGSFLRFDENTSFTMMASTYQEAEESRSIRIRMILGKAWARVSRLFKGRGGFAIETPTAVAGVRGTTYRLNLERDRSAMVKVYDGEVEVRRRMIEYRPAQGPAPLKTPHPVAGPEPVAGPKAVTMEEWVYIVGALQQIDIRADGTATEPFRFDIQADLDDWVRWNQTLDRMHEEKQ